MAISVMTWVWNHSRSRHGARLVLLAIADCASADGGNAWPSNAELQRKSGLAERAVQLAIGELIKLGELEVSYNAGPKGCNAYRVVMDGDPRNICTPAENAPPQKMRGSRGGRKSSKQVTPETPADSAPPQILRAPPANIAPVTVLEPKPKTKTSSSSSAREPRGTRIPADFAVTDAMTDWARQNVPRLIAAGRGKYETDKFRDHWLQASGPTAVKRDWPAAWRNWLRRAEDDLPGNGRHPPARTTTNDRVQQAIEAGKRVQAMLNGES